MTEKRRATAKNTNIKNKMCILEELKVCDNCCACFDCEIDSSKICNNCAKCVEMNLAEILFAGKLLGNKFHSFQGIDKKLKKIIDGN